MIDCLRLLLLPAILTGCTLRVASGYCTSASSGWQVSLTTETGACYYFREAEYRLMENRSNVEALCSGATSLGSLPDIRLPRLTSEQEKFYLIRTMGSVGSGYWHVWTDAVCNATTSRFHWGDGAVVKDLKDTNCTSDQGVLFNSTVVPSDSGYVAVTVLHATPLNTVATAVCELMLPQCNVTTLTNYDSSRMQPSVTPFVGRDFKVNCAPGYFRSSELDAATASATRNHYTCQFVNVSGGLGYGKLVAKDADASVESCSSMHCLGQKLVDLNLQADFKESYKPSVEVTREYNFGDTIAVECVTGYVRIYTKTEVNSTILCQQNTIKLNEGEWRPMFCTPVGCNKTSMSAAYDSSSMMMYKAYDRLKDKTYSDAETHKFPYYPNTVHVRCRKSGEFFEDRKYDKTFQCDLLPGSVVNAGWKPTEGTLESSMRCKPITCLTNEVVIASQRNRMQDYMETGNFNDTVEVTDETGLKENITIKQFVSAGEYKFSIGVRMFCQSGFAMTSTNEADGKMVSITTLYTECSSTGTWSKQISECIKQSAAIDTGGGKRYVPEAKEAGSAQSLGAIVIVILVVFFSVIVVLDLATLSRDIKLLKQNIRRLKLKAHLRKME